MALPGPEMADQSWPPYMWDPIAHDQRLWSAWYSGKPSELAWSYMNLGANSQTGRAFFRNTGERSTNIPKPGQYRGGLLGSVDRTFWGTTPPAGEKRTKVHLPVAGDIAAMSADLLFAKRVKFDADAGGDTSVTEWCDERFDDDFHATMLEAADLCAGLGGIYLRTAWDSDLSDRSWIDLVHADAAVPTFRGGKLASVIFWKVLAQDGDKIHRHLEDHDLIDNVITHGVYVGDQTTLGEPVAVRDYPELEPVFAVLDDQNRIILPDLPGDCSTVTYVPNMRPNRYWRHINHASALGRSDYAGIEGVMDSIDETWSSWMRDIRLAKSRLLVPPDYLNDLGPGKGALADVEREVFVPLKMLAGTADSTAITANQFKIRWQEHQTTLLEGWRRAVSSAGYAPQTFGDTPSVAMTATEVQDRNQRSLLTWQRKTQYWRPGLRDAMYSMMCVDKAVFGAPVTPARPVVMFPEAIMPSLAETSQALVAMANADAASKQTMVAMLHPDWTPDQVLEEVERIRGESALDLLSRAKVSLAPPMGSTATIGQDVQEIQDDVQVGPDRDIQSYTDMELQ